ncbi:MAG TPA: hypothetical protein VJB59_06330 [Bdellovibrionota bacterium]|nr:hypothetical protein [Bdellovibrionota bacterium]
MEGVFLRYLIALSTVLVTPLLARALDPVVFSFDEAGLIKLELECWPESTGRTACSLKNWAPTRSKGSLNSILPLNVDDGFEFVVNGQPQKLKMTGGLNVNWDVRRSPTVGFPSGTATELEVRFYGHPIAQYRIQDNHLTQTMKPRQISRFDIRKFAEDAWNPSVGKDGKASMGIYNLVTGPDGSEHLRNWIKKPAFLSSETHPTSSFVDLHTHLTGAIRSEELLEIAEKVRVAYPVKHLEKLGLNYRKDAVFKLHGEKVIPFSKENISFSTFHDGPDYHYSSIYNGLDIYPNSTVPFEQMSKLYEIRSPILKDIRTFPLVLESIAKDYAKNGVKYAELSFYTIVNPEWLEIANHILPELEQKYGVKLRFLVGMWRHSTPEINKQLINETKNAMTKSPYVVGVDFMGHETNATADFKDALTEIAGMKKQFPNMAIRVHAGENANHLNNIRDAIKLGATRIGHGIYGVTDEVIDLAKKNNVIVEFNFNSNLALKNVEGTKELKAAVDRYMKAGVRVTFGTDGHGLYHTSPRSEEAVAKSLGLSQQQFKAVGASDRQYLATMTKDFTIRNRVLRGRSQKCLSTLLMHLAAPAK